MSDPLIDLTKAERAYVTSLTEKFLKQYALNPDFNPGAPRVVVERLHKFASESTEAGGIPIKRTGLRLLQRVTSRALKVLQKKIIPGYQARITRGGEYGAKYLSYLQQARGKVETLKVLLKKVEKML